MSHFQMIESKMICPASGPLLRAVIHAFSLMQESDTAPTGTLVGSGISERSERRYLEGVDPASEDVRNRVVADIASALLGMDFVTDAQLPFGLEHTLIRQTLVEAVTDWAKAWDEDFRQCSVGWPFIPLSLGGFVLGREVVMDLALRVAAVIHLTNTNLPAVVIHAAHDKAGKAILRDALSLSNHEFTHKNVAKAAEVEARTAQRWLNESIIPSDQALCQLARTLNSGTGNSEKAILRNLRVQFGLLRLAQHLESVIGQRWTRDLFLGFERLLNFAVSTNREIQQNPRQFGSDTNGLTRAQFELLKLGSNCSVANAVFKLWLRMDQPAI